VTPSQRQLDARELGRRLVLTMPPSVTAGFTGADRLTAAALERGTWEDSRTVVERRALLGATLSLGRVRWEGGRLVIPTRLDATWRGRPLLLSRQGAGYTFPADLTDGLVGGAELRIDDPLAGAWGGVALRDDERHTSWWATTSLVPRLEEHVDGVHPFLEGDVVVDPRTAAGGDPLPTGTHRLTYRGILLDTQRGGSVPAHLLPERFVLGSRVVRTARQRGGRGLVLVVRPAAKSLGREVSRGAVRGGLRTLRGQRSPVLCATDLAPVTIPDGWLALPAGQVDVRLLDGRHPELEIGRRTTLGTGVHRLRVAGRPLGPMIVVAGHIVWFRGSGRDRAATRAGARAWVPFRRTVGSAG
jgi:hypothetical protein